MNIDILPENVRNILENIVDDSGLRNYSIQLKSGSQVGDGFASELTSVIVKGERNDGSGTETELNLLCKFPPKNENRRNEFKSDVVFAREIYFYTKVLPTFMDFQREKFIPEADQFRAYPKCYAGLDGCEAIIMEDLRPKGFHIWRKGKPTTLGNLHLVLEQIGKFHAISFAMKDQRPDEFAQFKSLTDITIKIFESSSMQGLVHSSFERAKNAMHKNHNKDIMSKLQANFVGYYESYFNENMLSDFAVVTHGDLWNNNIMYHFNENNVVEDVRFVDWQVVRYMSPAVDLIYHIFTSTDKTLRDAEYMNLLRHYHNSLSQTIRKLGSDSDKLFTFDNLLSEMKKAGNIAFLLAPMILSVVLADPNQITNMDKMSDDMADGKQSQELITGLTDAAQIEYEKRLNDLVVDLVDLGYFKELN